MARPTGVGIVSLMDHTPGQRQLRDLTQLRHYLMGKHGFTVAEYDAHVAARLVMSAEVGAVQEAAAVAAGQRVA